MKLWIDDIRPAPIGWIWCKTSLEALYFLRGDIQEISFDHDLGGEDTSVKVAKYIEKLSYYGEKKPPIWKIHSANPVGRKNLESALLSAERYWKQGKTGLFQDDFIDKNENCNIDL